MLSDHLRVRQAASAIPADSAPTSTDSPDEITPYLLQFMGTTAGQFQAQLAGSAIMLAILWGFLLAQAVDYFTNGRKKEDGWWPFGLAFVVLSMTVQLAAWLYQTFDVLSNVTSYSSLLRIQTLTCLASYLIMWTVAVPICLSYFASNAVRVLGGRMWVKIWLFGGIGAATVAGVSAIIFFMTIPFPRDPTLSVLLGMYGKIMNWLRWTKIMVLIWMPLMISSSVSITGCLLYNVWRTRRRTHTTWTRSRSAYDAVLLLIGRSIVESMLPPLIVASVGCGFFLWGKSILIPIIYLGPAMPAVWCVCTFMAIRNRELVAQRLRVITNIGMSKPSLELELAPGPSREIRIETESDIRTDYLTYDSGPMMSDDWSNKYPQETTFASGIQPVMNG